MIRLRRLFALIAIAVALQDGAAAAGSNKCRLARIAEWPVQLERNLPIVEGAINGQAVGILLDTGTTRSVIVRSATERLGLTRQQVQGYRMFGVGGETVLEMVSIDEFKVGEFARKSWRVLVAGEHDFGKHIAAILGSDFFQQVDVEFDLPHKAVRLYEATDCDGVPLAYWATQGAGTVDLEPTDNVNPKDVLSIRVNGRPVRALLDSGAAHSTLAKSFAAALGVTPETPGVIPRGCDVGFGEKRASSWTGSFESFAIGDEIVRNPHLGFADLWRHMTSAETGSRIPRSVGTDPEMLLGVDFLRAHRLLIAHSQRRIYFTYAGGPVFPVEPLKLCGDGR